MDSRRTGSNRTIATTIRLTSLTLFAAFAAVFVGAEGSPSEGEGTLFAPLATYHSLVTDDQTVHSLGGGVLVLAEEDLFVGTYSNTRYADAPAPYQGDRFHAIDLLYDGGEDRRDTILLFKSASDRPIVGGWSTVQGAAVVGYDVLDRRRTSLVLGGGLAVGDFGIDTPAGDTWPLIPVPFVRFAYATPLITCSLDFITGPNATVEVTPTPDLHATVDVRVDQFRDARDVIFDASFGYRFLSVGVKNDTYSFIPYDEDESVETFYYAAYGSIDLEVLTITGGYAFDTVFRSDEISSVKTGDGYFLSVQALLPLGGSSNGDEK